ncbi:hypothetical protein ES703_70546 [subsurface metagenome]
MAKGSLSLNEGRYSLTGLSQSSLPSSARIPMVTAVKALEQEPIAKRVLGVTFKPFFTSRKPNPLEKMTFPSLTMDIPSPGTFHSSIVLVTNFSNPFRSTF